MKKTKICRTFAHSIFREGGFQALWYTEGLFLYVVSVVRCLWCINLIINVLKTFEELGVSAEIRQAIEEMGYENPMPVQEEVIPYLLGVNNDVVALAQTGTGKTTH